VCDLVHRGASPLFTSKFRSLGARYLYRGSRFYFRTRTISIRIQNKFSKQPLRPVIKTFFVYYFRQTAHFQYLVQRPKTRWAITARSSKQMLPRFLRLYSRLVRTKRCVVGGLAKPTGDRGAQQHHNIHALNCMGHMWVTWGRATPRSLVGDPYLHENEPSEASGYISTNLGFRLHY
jgi:hypothetical protein